MSRITTLKKPTLSAEAVRSFAESTSTSSAPRASTRAAAGTARSSASSPRSGQVPEGDVRLTANINADLHKKLKIRAVQQRTTVGELIEDWVRGWSD